VAIDAATPQTRKEIGDEEPCDQSENISAFVGELERPTHAEFLQVRGRHRREIGIATDNPAGIGDPEYSGESEREPLEVAL
jgi:hypothetical protein